MRARSGAALAIGLALAGVAWAQSPPSAGMQAVLACRAVKGGKAQLRCFREAAAALAGEAAPAPPSPAEPPRAFGAPPPPRVKAERAPQVRFAELVVRSIGDMGDGRAILNLEDGSTWVETESEPISSAVRPGDRIRLEKGALGGYFLVLPHRAGIHVARLRTEGR